MAETEFEAVLGTVEAERPDVFAVDSIQTMYHPAIPSAPGSVGRRCGKLAGG